MINRLKAKGLLAAIGTTLVLAVPQVAVAGPFVSVDLATLDTFVLVDTTETAPDFPNFGKTPSTSFGGIDFTDFTVDFAPDEGFESADVGATGLGLDWTGFDEFRINLRNQNENDWDFKVFVQDSSGTEAASSLQKLPAVPDTSPFSTFIVDITSLDRANIESVVFRVQAELPLGTSDTTAEFAASPVPVPATVTLLGAGLLAAGLVARRRR